MAIERRYVPVCEECIGTEPGLWGNTMREAAKAATAAGWRRQGGVLRCGECRGIDTLGHKE